MKEIRIAVLGNVDSAKTTLVSTITNKILDDGRGLARSKVFKHQHEKDTGRTSSISFRYIKVNDDKYTFATATTSSITETGGGGSASAGPVTVTA